MTTADDVARQYRHWAERLMRSMRIQRQRAYAKGEHASHDAEIYTLLLANYVSLVYRAAGRRKDEPDPIHPDVVQLSHDLEHRFPRLRRFRNFHGHPPFPEHTPDEVTWSGFSDGVWALLADGGAVPIADIELDHDFVEDVHDKLLTALDAVVDPPT